MEFLRANNSPREYRMLINFGPCFCIYDTLRHLVSLVQFIKREKHSWKGLTFSKCYSFFFSFFKLGFTP